MYKYMIVVSTSLFGGAKMNLMVIDVEKGNSGSNKLPLKVLNS